MHQVSLYPCASNYTSRFAFSIIVGLISGLILCGRAGKHIDELAIELVTSTESKTK